MVKYTDIRFPFRLLYLSFADCGVPASLHPPVCHLLQGHQGSLGLHQGNKKQQGDKLTR